MDPNPGTIVKSESWLQYDADYTREFFESVSRYAVITLVIARKFKRAPWQVDLQEEAVKYIAQHLDAFYREDAFKRIRRMQLRRILAASTITQKKAVRYRAVARWISAEECRAGAAHLFRDLLPDRNEMSWWESVKVKMTKLRYAKIFYESRF